MNNTIGHSMDISKEQMSQQFQLTSSSLPLTLEDPALLVTNGFKDKNTSIDTKFRNFEQKILQRSPNWKKKQINYHKKSMQSKIGAKKPNACFCLLT